jgi:hypothetical protein
MLRTDTEMLASLLPGLRELRAPLAAGALWLTAIFVATRAIAERDIRIAALRPVIDSFSALGSSIDETWGAGVILTFTAFLVGALSHGFITDLLRSVSDSVSGRGRRSINLVARQRMASIVDALDLDHLTKVRTSAIDPVLDTAILYARRNLGEAVELDEETQKIKEKEEEEEEREHRRPDMVLTEEQAKWLKPYEEKWRDSVRSGLEERVPVEIEDELQLVATRLIGREPGLFEQYDRLRGEAEFRMGLVPPLAALSLTVAFVAFSWIAVLIALAELVLLAFVAYGLYEFIDWGFDWEELIPATVAAVIGVGVFVLGGVVLFDQETGEMLVALATVAVLLGVTAAILLQGMKIQRAAGDLLADAIFVGRVQSPLLERLTAETKSGESPAT